MHYVQVCDSLFRAERDGVFIGRNNIEYKNCTFGQYLSVAYPENDQIQVWLSEKDILLSYSNYTRFVYEDDKDGKRMASLSTISNWYQTPAMSTEVKQFLKEFLLHLIKEDKDE